MYYISPFILGQNKAEVNRKTNHKSCHKIVTKFRLTGVYLLCYVLGRRMYTTGGDNMKINLSDSEWKLMNHLWARSPMTIMELTADLSNDTGWTKISWERFLAEIWG